MGHLWLIGMMGAGKNAVGRRVADLTGASFVDTDALIVAAARHSIAEVFAETGEAGFRQRERDAVEEAAAGPDSVVATGGGVVTNAGNVARMRASGLVVWLRVPTEELAGRVGSGSGRPLLAGGDPRARLEELEKERRPLYAGAAHAVVDAGGRDAGTVAKEVAGLWQPCS